MIQPLLRLAACALAVTFTAAGCARNAASTGSTTTSTTTGTNTTGASNPAVPSATGGEVSRPGMSSGTSMGGSPIRGGGMAVGR